MEQRKKEVISWIVMICSFIILILFFPIIFLIGFDSGPVASAIFMILVIVYFGSLIAAIGYSVNGWAIEGSTLEWIIAAIIAPFLTLILYFMSKNQERGETIDLNDQERLQRL